MSFAVTFLLVSSISESCLVWISLLLINCYLSRYGVYATVFLYQAKCVGAFQNEVQRQELADLVLRFIEVMEEAPSMETHICHSYSRMLGQLWNGREARNAVSQATRRQSNTDMSRHGQGEFEIVAEPSHLPMASSPALARADQDSPGWDWDCLGNRNSYSTPGTSGQRNDIPDFPTIEAYPFGSFWPGVTEFWRQEEVQNTFLEQQDPSTDGAHQSHVEDPVHYLS